MDSQISSHGSSYAYSSPQYPEFYDLWVSQLFGTALDADAAVFSSLFLPLLKLPPPIDVTVVDVGTGTGRVIKNLYKSIAAHPIDTDASVAFYGFDNSQAMLDRAERTFNVDVAAAIPVSNNVNVTPTWKVATASNFSQELGLSEGSVDLILFAAGGIGHLTLDEEVECFLNEVHRSMRETGRAVLSVLNDMVKTPGSESVKPGDQDKQVEQSMEIKSLETEGLVYIKSPTVRKIEGNLMTEKFSVKGVKLGENGAVGEKAAPLWEQELSWSLRFFDEEKWKAAVDKVGLNIEKVEDGGFQRWYILKRKPLLGA